MTNNYFFRQRYTLPSAFYFNLKFDGIDEVESQFEEVSGLKVKLGTEEREAGGENEFVHHLPSAPKYENLILKRCLSSNSYLEQWCRDALEDHKLVPKDIILSLIASDGAVLTSWSIIGVVPISWELASLNSTSNQMALETLTLNYQYFKKN